MHITMCLVCHSLWCTHAHIDIAAQRRANSGLKAFSQRRLEVPKRCSGEYLWLYLGAQECFGLGTVKALQSAQSGLSEACP